LHVFRRAGSRTATGLNFSGQTKSRCSLVVRPPPRPQPSVTAYRHSRCWRPWPSRTRNGGIDSRKSVRASMRAKRLPSICLLAGKPSCFEKGTASAASPSSSQPPVGRARHQPRADSTYVRTRGTSGRCSCCGVTQCGGYMLSASRCARRRASRRRRARSSAEPFIRIFHTPAY